MTGATQASVIVPHYNDARGLELCLAALEKQTFPNGSFEIIVADNGSTLPEAVLRDLIGSRAKLVVVRERGAGPARNGGVAVASGKVLAFTDSDCQPEPSWLSEGVAALSHCDFAGGRVKVLVADCENLTAAEAFERAFAFDNEAYVRKKGFTVTANLFCPRRTFDIVGGFHVGVSEDIEWSHRARAAGFRIGYAPNAVVGHPARRNWQDLQTKWRRMSAEQFGLARRERLGRLKWLIRTMLLPASALAHTPKALLTSELSSLADRCRALSVLYRLRMWRFANALNLYFGRK